MSGYVGTDKAFNYNLEVLTLVNNEGEGFDIRRTFLGLELTESITQNFLQGAITINDSTGMIENAKLFGQETLRLRFSSPSIPDAEGKDTDPDRDTIDQIFRIYHVGEVQRVGQNTLTYLLRFCAPELIHAKRIRISQAYKGSLIETASKIARDHLGIELSDGAARADHMPYFETSIWDKNQDVKVVIPNWTVNYAINWLCKEAQGRDDADALQDTCFFYQTACGGYRIDNLSQMLIPSAAGTTFYYSIPNIESATEARKDFDTIPWDLDPKLASNKSNTIGMGRRIQGYEIGSIANVMEATVEGLFSSKQTTIFTREQYMHETSFNYHQKFFGDDGPMGTATGEHPLVRQEDETLYWGEAAAGDEDVKVHPYPNEVIYGEPISNYKDANQVLTSQTNLVHDVGGTTKSLNNDTHVGTALFRQATEQLIPDLERDGYYTMHLVLPCRTDISTGTIIDVEIPPARPGESKPPAGGPNFHTGSHLVTDIEWKLTLTECKVKVSCIKDSLLTKIETAPIYYPPTIMEEEAV